jgi:hypothetical protein
VRFHGCSPCGLKNHVPAWGLLTSEQIKIYLSNAAGRKKPLLPIFLFSA